MILGRKQRQTGSQRRRSGFGRLARLGARAIGLGARAIRLATAARYDDRLERAMIAGSEELLAAKVFEHAFDNLRVLVARLSKADDDVGQVRTDAAQSGDAARTVDENDVRRFQQLGPQAIEIFLAAKGGVERIPIEVSGRLVLGRQARRQEMKRPSVIGGSARMKGTEVMSEIGRKLVPPSRRLGSVLGR